MTARSISSTTRRLAVALSVSVVAGLVAFEAPAADASPSTDQIIDAQMLVYEINEARWNPAAFRARADDITMPADVPPAPPLAIVGTLASSATFKANEIADHGYFAHQSAVTGIWPNRLARDHGYPLPSPFSDTTNNIESLHGGSPDPFRVLVSFANSPSHRRHIFGEGWFETHRQIGVGRSANQNYWAVHTAYATTSDVFVTGVVYHDANGNGRMDRGEGLGGITVKVGSATTTTNAGGGYSIKVSPGTYSVTASGAGFAGTPSAQVQVSSYNVGVDFVSGRATPIIKSYASSGWGSGTTNTSLCPNGSTCDTVTFVDNGGRWFRYSAASPSATVNAFYYGNSGDVPFSGDWNGNGTATTGLYRQADGFAYLRHSNTQGIADVTFYFGNSGDMPLIGDFNGNGRDTVSLYRPSQTRVYIINRLGQNGGGLGAADYSFTIGNTGDRPFVGDFNGNGVDTVGLYRPSNGWVYLRNSNSSGPAHVSFHIGTGWDSVFAGDWNGDGKDTVAAYRRSTGIVFFAAENSATTTGFTLQVGSFRAAVPSAQS